MKPNTLNLLAQTKTFLEEELDPELEAAAKLNYEISFARNREAVDQLFTGQGPDRVEPNDNGKGLCDFWIGCPCVVNPEVRLDLYLRVIPDKKNVWTIITSTHPGPWLKSRMNKEVWILELAQG